MKPGNFGTVLADFLASRRAMPFAWGTNDCITFPADLSVAFGFEDFIAAERGTWANALEAASVLLSAGYTDLAEMAEDRLEACPVAFAGRGDIGLVRNEGKVGLYAYSLGVFVTGGIAGPGEAGLLKYPRTYAVAAYRAG